ncbi:hypothetical protein [Flavobacterium humi]|nr:hypothetical protein [Flavobacterium humi]
MKTIFTALFRLLTGKPVVPPPKHHHDQNEGDEGIDDAVRSKEQKPGPKM